MIALARHSEWMTLTPRAIHATGGASANTDILQIMADVFKSPVYRFDSTDAAALGAALRGLQAHTGRQWQDAVGEFVKPLSDRISPIAENLRLYDHLKDRYASLERAVLSL